MPARITIGSVPFGKSASKAMRGAVRKHLVRWARQLERSNRAAFVAGGHQNHGGRRWAPLAPSTLREKARLGLHTMLVRKGAMRRSIHARQRPGRRLGVELRALDPKVKWHQHGTSRMPRRLVVQVASRDRRDLRRALVVDLNALLGSGEFQR